MRVRAEIVNPERRDRTITVDSALIDRGATRTTVSRTIADQLGLELLGRSIIDTAAGARAIDESYARVRLPDYKDKASFADIWISDELSGVIIGVITLEALELAVDPKNGRLINVPGLLL